MEFTTALQMLITPIVFHLYVKYLLCQQLFYISFSNKRYWPNNSQFTKQRVTSFQWKNFINWFEDHSEKISKKFFCKKLCIRLIYLIHMTAATVLNAVIICYYKVANLTFKDGDFILHPCNCFFLLVFDFH